MRAAAAAAILTVVPDHVPQSRKFPPLHASALNQLLCPNAIPGARECRMVVHHPKAEILLIHVRQEHLHPDQHNLESVTKVQSDISKILLFLMEKFPSFVVMPEGWTEQMRDAAARIDEFDYVRELHRMEQATAQAAENYRAGKNPSFPSKPSYTPDERAGREAYEAFLQGWRMNEEGLRRQLEKVGPQQFNADQARIAMHRAEPVIALEAWWQLRSALGRRLVCGESDSTYQAAVKLIKNKRAQDFTREDWETFDGRRQMDVLRRAAAQCMGNVVIVPFGSFHAFENTVNAWNAEHPRFPISLVVIVPDHEETRPHEMFKPKMKAKE